jgi:FkbM family methyltransferase
LLDRPGGRFILGKIATLYVRRMTGDTIELTYRYGLWTHRVGANFFPDAPTFYTFLDFEAWKGQADAYVSQAEDFYLYEYTPKQGDVIIDIGAGRGEDTLAFSRGVGPLGRVIAVEAHPLSFVILKSFCRLNELTNVTALEVALMDKTGTVHVVESASSWKESAVEHNEGPLGGPVRASTLDEVCAEQGIGEIAFLKINIEGAERYALLGTERVLPRVRHICVACHDFRAEQGHGEQFRTRSFVERFLVEHGFTLSFRPADPRDYIRDHVYGSRNA